MKRVFMIDVLACPRCGSSMSIISVLKAILDKCQLKLLVFDAIVTFGFERRSTQP